MTELETGSLKQTVHGPLFELVEVRKKERKNEKRKKNRKRRKERNVCGCVCASAYVHTAFRENKIKTFVFNLLVF